MPLTDPPSPECTSACLVAKQRSAFGAELHMVLMFLQACNSLAAAEVFIAESETQWTEHRAALAEVLRRSSSVTIRDPLAHTWAIADAELPAEIYTAANLRGQEFCRKVAARLADADALRGGAAPPW